MRVVGQSLDDILRKLYQRIIRSRNRPEASRGATREIVGALLELTNPRARLSRSETRAVLYTGIGELLWYLSRDNRLDFIQYYLPRYASDSDDGETIHGGYGPRLFGHRGINQIQNVIDRLGDPKKRSSRRAVIQMFDAEDFAGSHKEIPCTTTLQFLVRSKRLHMITAMRSNDAWFGLPHDIFCFTMLQEIVARTLGLGVGRYRHFAGSLHLYEEHVPQAQEYLDEGVQGLVAMPAMPAGNPWKSVAVLQEAERRIRRDLTLPTSVDGLDPYWGDMVRLLSVFAATGSKTRIAALRAQIVNPEYAMYVDAQKRKKARQVAAPAQYELPF